MNKLQKLLTIILCGASVSAMAQTSIGRAEYWVDSDPGLGRGSSVSFAVGAEPDVSIDLNTSALSAGWHVVGVRVAGGGKWSQTYTHRFIKFAIPADQSEISGAEYWVDTDPGQGSAIQAGFTPFQTEFNLPINTEALPAGNHVVGLRVRKGGLWSQTYTHSFVKFAVSVGLNISGAEFWVDSDPGLGRASSIPCNVGQGEFIVPLNTKSLASGVHTVGLRVRNGDLWSQTYTHRFVKFDTGFNSDEVTGVEYWVDSDPGLGSATSFNFSPGQNEFNVPLSTESLAPGVHTVGMRVRMGGQWSQTYTHTFVKFASGANSDKVSGVEYWIDSDPGLGSATPMSFTPDQEEFTLPLATDNLTDGVHVVGLRVSKGGIWSQTYTHKFVKSSYSGPLRFDAVEYFWDGDIDKSVAIPFTMNGDSVVIENFSINTESLSYGLHYIYLRARANGVWSIISRYPVCKNAKPMFSMDAYELCASETAIIYDETTETTPNTTYSWDMNSDGEAEYTRSDMSDDMLTHTFTSAGSYTVKLTVASGEGCETSYEKKVYVYSSSAPSVSIGSNKSSICVGDTVVFTATSSNVGLEPSYVWYLNDEVIAGETKDTLRLATLSNGDKVKVGVRSANPCKGATKEVVSSARTITVNALPDVAIEAIPTQYKDNKAFALNVGTPSGGSYYVNGIASSAFNPKSSNNEVGEYTVSYVYKNNSGCEASAETSFLLKVRQNVTVIVDANDDSFGSVTGGCTMLEGNDLVISAAPKTGYEFVKWSDGVTDSERTIFIDRDTAFTAEFAPKSYTVVYTVDGDTVGDVETYKFGSLVEIRAAYEKEGYTVSAWSETKDFNMPAENVVITATSTINKYAIKYYVDSELYKTDSCEFGKAIVLIDAPKKDGYTFSGWESDYAKMPAKDIAVNGSFEINKYSVSFVSEGVVLQEGKMEYGATPKYTGDAVTKSATKAHTYTFDGWNPEISAVKGDVVYTAVFDSVLNVYTLTVSADADMGTVSGGGKYEYGEKATLKATAKEGYGFVKWSDKETANPRTITVEDDMSLAAEFAPKSYTVVYTVDGDTVGDVETYKYGAKVVLRDAYEKEGYTVSAWSMTKDFDMPAENVAITATSTINKYAVKYYVDSELYKTDSCEFNKAVVLIDAPEKDGYTFSGWESDYAKMPAKDIAVSGSFAINKYSVSFVSEGVVLQIKKMEYGTMPEYEGSAVTKKSSKSYDYTFDGWDPVISLVKSDVVYTAKFDSVLKSYTLVVTSDDTDKGTVTGGGKFEYGDKAVITAVPAAGYKFVKWDDDETDNPRTVIVESDMSVKAIFKEITVDTTTYNITVFCDVKMGSVAGGGKYEEGEKATLTATANTGYRFLKWSDNKSDNPRKIVVSEDLEISAIFVPVYNVTVSCDTKMGSVAGGGTYDKDSEATITASAKNGYKFVKWNDGVTINPRTIVVTEDIEISAVFESVSTGIDFAPVTIFGDAVAGWIAPPLGECITMTDDDKDGVFTTEFETMGGYFVVVSDALSCNGDWTCLNNNRFAPSENGADVTDGTVSFGKYQNDDNSFFIPEGKYILEINMVNKTIVAVPKTTSDVISVFDNDDVVVRTEYFDILGRKVVKATKGVCLMKLTYKSGKTEVKKVIVYDK